MTPVDDPGGEETRFSAAQRGAAARLDAAIRAAAMDAPPPGPCPGDEAFLDFQRRLLDETAEEAIRDHIAWCSGCVARARDARDFAETVCPAAGPAAPGRRFAWIGLAAALAACIAAVAFLMERRGAPVPRTAPAPALAWNDIAVEPPPYHPPAPGPAGDVVYRDGTSPDPFETAMERYGAGDFAAAEAALESLVALRPADTRARFYLAITRLVGGRAEDARRELQRLEASDAGQDRDTLAWYMSLALLKCGRPDEARPRLAALANGTGPRAGEARALIERLDRESGR